MFSSIHVLHHVKQLLLLFAMLFSPLAITITTTTTQDFLVNRAFADVTEYSGTGNFPMKVYACHSILVKTSIWIFIGIFSSGNVTWGGLCMCLHDSHATGNTEIIPNKTGIWCARKRQTINNWLSFCWKRWNSCWCNNHTTNMLLNSFTLNLILLILLITND